jgi:hypothetical protein
MKYLKRFNENYDVKDKPQWFSELEDFCQTSLAYLIDEGYEVNCDNNVNKFPEPPGFCAHYEGSTGVIVNLYNLGKIRNREAFNWSEIKDYYIPFLKLLSRRYRLLNFNLFPKANKSYDSDETKLICIHGEGYNKIFGRKTPLELAYYTLNDLINDNISDETKIYGISVKVVEKL